MNKKKAEEFEQFIERIHKLVEDQDAQVTWNDHIVDPDNPDQCRQIDVTIHRPCHLTHVECRIRNTPQDVKWIEELIGRRASLRADAMIAVSASGFTKGAIKKAEAHGIILRTLNTLSEQEIRSWGKPTDVQVIYYRFTGTQITIRIARTATISNACITDEKGALPNYRGLFEAIMRKLADDPATTGVDEPIKIKTAVTAPVLLIDGVKPTACQISTTVQRIVRRLSLASVVTYSPVGRDLTENAYIQYFDTEGFEVLQNSEDVAVVIDLTDAPTPPSSFLHTVHFDFGRVVTLNWVKPIGVSEAMDYSTDLSIRVEWG